MPTLNITFFLITGSLLAVIHALALQAALYWRYPWFDIPMHILGGIVLVFALATLRDMRLLTAPFFFKLGNVLAIVLGGAIVWEIFQFFMLGHSKDGFIVDTITDICMGLVGALIGFFVARSLSTLDI